MHVLIFSKIYPMRPKIFSRPNRWYSKKILEEEIISSRRLLFHQPEYAENMLIYSSHNVMKDPENAFRYLQN